MICETWEYRVWREPPETDDAARGPLVERISCCIQAYLDWARVTADAFSGDPSQQQQNRVCCQAKERLRGILLERPVHNCELLRRLDAVACPAPNAQNFPQGMQEALLAMVTVWFEALMACFCSALLPPCPGPQADNCVPLATVTVRRGQASCRVLRVCNWSVHRKFATTFPALQYWLSVLPFGRFIREAMEELCCNLSVRFGRGDDFVPSGDLDSTGVPRPAAESDMNAAGQPRSATSTGAGQAAGFQVNDPLPFASARSREVSTLLASVALGIATPVDPMTLFRGLAGRIQPAEETDPASGSVRKPRLTTLEREHLPQYLLASQLVPSALAGLAPHDLESLLPGVMGLAARAGIGGRGARTAASAPTEGGADVEAVRRELTELRAGMEAQQRTIQSLTERLDNR